jgi:hypothetical protein
MRSNDKKRITRRGGVSQKHAVLIECDDDDGVERITQPASWTLTCACGWERRFAGSNFEAGDTAALHIARETGSHTRG